MRVKFFVREPASLFHFLDSISEWDIQTRKNVKKYYLKEYGIEESDEELIKEYVRIRKKYPWKELDSDFYLADGLEEAYENLSKRLKEDEVLLMRKIIHNFYPNVSAIFLKWRPLLLRRKEKLEKEISKDSFKKILGELNKFYNLNEPADKINIHLVVNPSENIHGGGANISPNENISVEPLNLKKSEDSIVMKDICVVLHELTHVIERKTDRRLWMGLVRTAEKNKLNFEILNEAIIDSLVPRGYLAFKYKLVDKELPVMFKDVKDISMERGRNERAYLRKSRQRLSSMIYPLTKKQVDGGKNLFEGDYIEKCVERYIDMRRRT